MREPITTASATPRDRLRTCSVANAKADSYRQAAIAPNYRKARRDGSHIKMPGTGDPLQADVIQKARRLLGDRRYSLVGCRRRKQKDRVNASGLQLRRRLNRFLRRIVDHEHTVDPCCLRRARKFSAPHALDRIGISHQHDRRDRIRFTKLCHDGDSVLKTDAVTYRAFRCALNHRTVGHRIRKRNAEFDHVGSHAHQRVHQRHG